jgi:uncharacterized membrane protein (DUF2068 family)
MIPHNISPSEKASETLTAPALVQAPPAKNRYLRTIALYKIAKGVALLFIGISLVFFSVRTVLHDAVLGWLNDELLLPHGVIFQYLLHKLQTFLASDTVKSTGILALIYAVVLWIEGVGVYLGKRWAEWFMVLATASLIPLEIYHFVHKPTIVKIIVVAANTAIVAYLWWILRRNSHSHSPTTVAPGALP